MDVGLLLKSPLQVICREPSTYPSSHSELGGETTQQSWDFEGGEVILPCFGVLDECGVCDGAGIPEGACDCAGSLPAYARDCDGNCIEDADGDGICDDEDACVPSVAAQGDFLYPLTVEASSAGIWGPPTDST